MAVAVKFIPYRFLSTIKDDTEFFLSQQIANIISLVTVTYLAKKGTTSIRSIMDTSGLFTQLNSEVYSHCIMGLAKPSLIGYYQEITVNSVYALLEDIRHVRSTYLCNFDGKLAAIVPYRENLNYGELHYNI